jgi:FkbM family methyltransferase
VRLLETLGIEQLVDVGANEGQYAHEVRDAGFTGTIVSCEPIEVVYRQLTRAAKGDPLWRCHRVALGETHGEATLRVARLSVFSSILAPGDELLALDPRARAVHLEQVPMLTLDEFVDQACDGRALGVKIDAQGAERQILSGGPRTLARAGYLELELSPRPLYDGEEAMEDILAWLHGLGFLLSLVENVASDGKSGRAIQINAVFSRL